MSLRDEIAAKLGGVDNEYAIVMADALMSVVERGLAAERERADRAEAEQEALSGMRDEVLQYQREFHRLRADAERYRWLRNKAREELLYPARAGGEVPDLRTKWEVPMLICSGPVSGFRSFDEAIDAARGES